MPLLQSWGPKPVIFFPSFNIFMVYYTIYITYIQVLCFYSLTNIFDPPEIYFGRWSEIRNQLYFFIVGNPFVSALFIN